MSNSDPHESPRSGDPLDLQSVLPTDGDDDGRDDVDDVPPVLNAPSGTDGQETGETPD
jgi:hypothetical protein